MRDILKVCGEAVLTAIGIAKTTINGRPLIHKVIATGHIRPRGVSIHVARSGLHIHMLLFVHIMCLCIRSCLFISCCPSICCCFISHCSIHLVLFIHILLSIHLMLLVQPLR